MLLQTKLYIPPPRPNLIPRPRLAELAFYPILGYGLIAVAALGIGWSLVFTVMYLRMRSSRSK